MTREEQKRRRVQCCSNRQNRQLLQVQTLFEAQLKLHAEAEISCRVFLEREKLLCDTVLHQQFLCELFENKGLWQQKEGLCSAAPWQTQQQQHSKQQTLSSYVARLLHQDVQPQVQQVLQMTAQDWLVYCANVFPKLVFLLELCHRSDQHSSHLQPAGKDDADSACQHSPAQDYSCGAGMRGAATAVALNQHGQHRQAQTAAPCSTDGSVCAGAQPNLLACWFGNQPPLGQSPSADYQQLQETIDSVGTLVMLAYVFNHVPLLQACTCSYSPGPQVRPTAKHWEDVADHLHLTELQEVHMSLCLEEYRRLNQGSRADGGVLLQTSATPTLLVAAAKQQQQRHHQQQQQEQMLQQQQQQEQMLQREAAEDTHHHQQQQQQGQAQARKASAPGADAPAGLRRSSRRCGAQSTGTGQQNPQDPQQNPTQELCWQPEPQDSESPEGQDQLRDRLQQYVQRRHVHLLSAATFFINTLSPYQLALLISRSYPWLPSFTAVAEVVSKRVQARQQQRLQSVAQTAGSVTPIGSRGTSPSAADVGGSPGGSDGAHGSGSGSGFLQGTIVQHEQRRVAELERHRKLCWSDLNAISHSLQQ